MSETITRNPVAELAAWLSQQAWSEFAQSLAHQFARTGRLSAAQVSAGERMRAKVQARAAARPAAQPHVDPVTEVGFYLTADGRVWKVVRGQNGNLYAKVRTEAGWAYAAGAIRTLTASNKVTPEIAAAHGIRTGICLFCNAELDDRDGLGKVVGVGPVCCRKHLGMTQRQLADRLGVQPQARAAEPCVIAAQAVAEMAPQSDVTIARRAVRHARLRGHVVTAAESAAIDRVLERMGPEGLYMDGEVFAEMGAYLD